ncbi:MAG TPA: RecQ family ATP-dependent DNA helicase, partial [Thermodesulfovibrionia bacterium]|nr:RecQ family ATP-dependent DNA helicase [Thermodesulfovibrionia bacterium]
MDVSEFLSKCLCLDLEAAKDNIFRIGAVCGETTFEHKSRSNQVQAFAELDKMAESASYLLGHNIIDYDLPLLARVAPALKLHKIPVVDTLFLSPLAFPENPYHRLVKDYKLVKDSVNNPVADARLAVTLFQDEWESFAKLKASGHENLLSLYRFFLSNQLDKDLHSQGFTAVFDNSGVSALEQDKVLEVISSTLEGLVCQSALMTGMAEWVSNSQTRKAMAYCVAWLRVAGANSVIPPWVRHRFPDVVPVLKSLRDIPCSRQDCIYCMRTHNPALQLCRYFGFSSFRAKPAGPDGAALQEAVTLAADTPLLAIMP